MPTCRTYTVRIAACEGEIARLLSELESAESERDAWIDRARRICRAMADHPHGAFLWLLLSEECRASLEAAAAELAIPARLAEGA